MCDDNIITLVCVLSIVAIICSLWAINKIMRELLVMKSYFNVVINSNQVISETVCRFSGLFVDLKMVELIAVRDSLVKILRDASDEEDYEKCDQITSAIRDIDAIQSEYNNTIRKND